MSWPYTPHQCPGCRYFVGFERVARDDRGHELAGACAHPRTGMELFVARGELRRRLGDCALFIAAAASADRRP